MISMRSRSEITDPWMIRVPAAVLLLLQGSTPSRRRAGSPDQHHRQGRNVPPGKLRDRQLRRSSSDHPPSPLLPPAGEPGPADLEHDPLVRTVAGIRSSFRL